MNIVVNTTGILCWIVIIGIIAGKLWNYFKERQKLNINNRWVIVTGCDSGIGSGLVTKLVAENASVIAFNYTKDGAERSLKEGAKLALCLDITDDAAIQKAIQQIKETCSGQLWGLVHNAGAVQPGFIEYQQLATYQRIMDVNFFAVVRLTQSLIPFIKPTQGRIVIVSSVDGIVSLPGNAPYDASKFAVEAYADALRVELSFWNVNVSVINPSTMRTPLALGFFESHQKAWDMMDKQDPQGAWKEAWTKEWLDKYVAANVKNLERIAQDPIHAINDIMHALSARHPKLRYLSGTLAKSLFYALWKMPEHWSFLIKKGTVNPPPNMTR
jgi:NAD(P)-dependent dehydrogenase (short-subunit alcohol dehydrogenase family)